MTKSFICSMFLLYFGLGIAVELIDERGDYAYSENYANKFHQTPEYQTYNKLNAVLDKIMQEEKVTKENVLQLNRELASFVDVIARSSQDFSSETAILSNMYMGLVSKIKSVYKSHQKEFDNVISKLSEVEVAALKEILKAEEI